MAEKPSSPTFGSHPDLVELVTCSICFEYCKDARALPCLHSYCKECLQGLVKRGKITCPHCRLEVEVPNSDVSNLQANFLVNNVLDVLNSANYISNDDSLNDKNATNHSQCSIHPEKEYELFCQNCSKLICYKCISNWGTCGQHAYESIDTVVKIHRKNVEDFLQKRQELLPSIIKHGRVLADVKERQSENVFNVLKQISDTFNKHVESLKQRQDLLTKQAFDMQWKNDDGLSAEIDRVQLKQAEVENTIEFCQKLLKINDPTTFLQTCPKNSKEVFQDSNCEDLVSHVDLAPLQFQAADALLNDVISNFGNVLSTDEASTAEKEKSARAGEPSTSKQRSIATQCQPLSQTAHERRPVRRGARAQIAAAQPVFWRFYSKNRGSCNVLLTNGGLSATTVHQKNVAIIGKPGFLGGKHSWNIKVSGFPDGLSIGICVGCNGHGVTVTYDSQLKNGLFAAMYVQVDLDCDAKVFAVQPNGYQKEIVSFENPTNSMVHPYFYLLGRSQYGYNIITIRSMDGKIVEATNESCCIV